MPVIDKDAHIGLLSMNDTENSYFNLPEVGGRMVFLQGTRITYNGNGNGNEVASSYGDSRKGTLPRLVVGLVSHALPHPFKHPTDLLTITFSMEHEITLLI